MTNQRSDSFRWILRKGSTISNTPLDRASTPVVQRSETIQIASQYRPQNYVEQGVSAYNLKWPNLRKWLVEERFKDVPELDTSLVHNLGYVHDYYNFYVPKELTPSDQKAINRLRDVTSRTNKHSYRDASPDPNPDDDDDD